MIQNVIYVHVHVSIYGILIKVAGEGDCDPS